MELFIFVSVRLLGALTFSLFVYLLLSKIEDLKAVELFLSLFPSWCRSWAGFIWLGITAKFAIFCGYLYFMWLANARNLHVFYGGLGCYAFGVLVALAAWMRNKDKVEAKF